MAAQLQRATQELTPSGSQVLLNRPAAKPPIGVVKVDDSSNLHAMSIAAVALCLDFASLVVMIQMFSKLAVFTKYSI